MQRGNSAADELFVSTLSDVLMGYFGGLEGAQGLLKDGGRSIAVEVLNRLDLQGVVESTPRKAPRDEAAVTAEQVRVFQAAWWLPRSEGRD